MMNDWIKSARRADLRLLENQSADRQLDLFAPELPQNDDVDDVADVSGSLIATKLREINPDDLTARQALELVYEWKRLAENTPE